MSAMGEQLNFQVLVLIIKKLNTGRATQNNEISVKILKQNADIFSDYIFVFFVVFCK